MRLTQWLFAAEDPGDSESESDNGSTENREPVRTPALLPVPTSLAKPGDSLCDTCTALELTPSRFVVLPGDSDAGRNKPDNQTMKLGLVKDVKERSTSCPFCRLVLKALFTGEPIEMDDEEAVHVTMSWNTNGPYADPEQPWNHIPKTRVLRPYARTESGGYLSVKKRNVGPEIKLLANDAPTPSKSYFSRLIGDQINFSMVRNWLAMCHAVHGDFCTQTSKLDHEITDPAAEIPSFRLIDVVDSCIVLAPHHCKYVGLSYVWGNVDISSILRLLKANLEELEKPGSLLPKKNYEKIPLTIRDAMEVVRELHLRYLWTDSLCIIQDDDGDQGSKYDAISKMDLVYGAAYLTIVAATGIDANAGLPGLHPGSRRIAQPVEEIAPGFRLVFATSSRGYARSSVYHTRGWTFQEQLFAKRSLTFIGGQVEYTCQKSGGGWCEDVVFEDQHNQDYPGIGLRDKDANDIGEFEGLISEYSGLSLKFHSDIYNAFAGITRYLKSNLRSNLCHGIPDRFFDWFLLWQAMESQTRRNDAPSWSWSGWNGKSGGVYGDIWNWYQRSIKHVQQAQKKRTWIIWYQRNAHDSEECTRILPPKSDSASLSPVVTNFYGGHVNDRFPVDCTQTTPTARRLIRAPTYIRDAYNPIPGSGFLQFWTVSAKFNLGVPTSLHEGLMPPNGYNRLGILGKKNYEVGIIFVNPAWYKDNLSKTHEFILICEARDKKAPDGHSPDEERGWRYMVMLIEWHGHRQWAERVAVGWIKKRHLTRALKGGPVWKEIVLG